MFRNLLTYKKCSSCCGDIMRFGLILQLKCIAATDIHYGGAMNNLLQLCIYWVHINVDVELWTLPKAISAGYIQYFSSFLSLFLLLTAFIYSYIIFTSNLKQQMLCNFFLNFTSRTWNGMCRFFVFFKTPIRKTM